jgi:DNA repair exonuclease SbcCD ATPase subunit
MITMSKFISHFRRAAQLTALIIGASLLTACSAIKLAYNQAPDLSYWWLDGYFDFNEQQTPKVRDELAQLFAWHRTNELPKTADLLAQTAQQLAGEINAQQACKTYADVRGLIDNITKQALPALADIALSITPDQVTHLKRKYAKNTDEFQRDYLQGSAASRESKRYKRAIDRAEMLYGKLEEAQFSAIRQSLAVSSFDATLSLKERQRRQQELTGILTLWTSNKASQMQAQQILRGYFQRAWESPDAAYRSYVQRLTQEACASFASVHASTTPAQRAYAVRVLKGYQTDLRTLASAR